MFTSQANANSPGCNAGEAFIPLIRAAATIGFAIAPYSLGFVIIAVSEQLIRTIMVGEVPEMLVSDLQNQFPHELIEATEKVPEGLVAQVVASLERGERPSAAHFEYQDASRPAESLAEN